MIQGFLDTMRREWLPGFEQSYQRRSKEYQEALKKYEKRGLFLRTLLRKPKMPNRLPARYPADVERRLLADWRESFTEDRKAINSEAVLEETFGEDFLALYDLRLEINLDIMLLVVGPPGIILTAETAETGTQPSQPEKSLKRAQATIVDILQASAATNVPIYSGSKSDRQAYLTDIAARNELEPQKVWAVTDLLLDRHQALSESGTLSALAAAEKLTAREKDNFLRMAATL